MEKQLRASQQSDAKSKIGHGYEQSSFESSMKQKPSGLGFSDIADRKQTTSKVKDTRKIKQDNYTVSRHSQRSNQTFATQACTLREESSKCTNKDMSELKLSGKLISEHCESIISKHPRENLVSLRI